MRQPAWLALACGLSTFGVGAFGLSACECGASDRPRERAAEETAPEAPAPPGDPDPTLALAAAGPATVVSLRAGALLVDNQALLDSWPPAARRTAEAADPGDVPGWPRLERRLAHVSEGRAVPELVDTLRLARRIEASATGASSGAGVYHLRIGDEVPFVEVERVLYSASLAGYGRPRLRLAREGGERELPWPESPRADPAAVQAALEAFASGAPVPEPPAPAVTARVRLRANGVDVLVGATRQAAGCLDEAPPDARRTYPPTVDAAIVTRCLDALGDGPWALEIDAALPFGRVEPLLARMAVSGRPIRVVTR